MDHIGPLFQGIGKVYLAFDGSTVKKEFYQPDYSKPAPEHEREDLRPTLYWNPSIFLNEENKTFKFRFYNNDISKKLLVVVEGFSADGKLIYLEKTIGD